VVIFPLSCEHKLDLTDVEDQGRIEYMEALFKENCESDKNKKVHIYNKIRERFHFDVKKKIHLRNIVIDSLDSIIP